MKSNSTRNILAIVLILFTAVGCSKFDEGPEISFRSVINRLYGTYQIEFFTKNDTDLLPYWNQYYNISFSFQLDESQYSPDAHSIIVEGNIIDSLGVDHFYSIGYPLSINQDDHNVKFWMNNYMWDSTYYPGRKLYPVFVYQDEESPSFLITRLTNDEMWLKHIYENDVYEIHFKE